MTTVKNGIVTVGDAEYRWSMLKGVRASDRHLSLTGALYFE
jgi:hypothetical protein